MALFIDLESGFIGGTAKAGQIRKHGLIAASIQTEKGNCDE